MAGLVLEEVPLLVYDLLLDVVRESHALLRPDIAVTTEGGHRVADAALAVETLESLGHLVDGAGVGGLEFAPVLQDGQELFHLLPLVGVVLEEQVELVLEITTA